jgi:PhnB protein
VTIPPKPPQIIPYLIYRDVGAALDFLCVAFGFKEEMRHGTPSGGMHGEASFQAQRVMMGQGAHERSLKTPKDVGAATMGSFIYLDDVDKHYEVAKSGGRGNRPSAEGRRIRPHLLGERSRGTSLVLHEPAEGVEPSPHAVGREDGTLRKASEALADDGAQDR